MADQVDSNVTELRPKPANPSGAKADRKTERQRKAAALRSRRYRERQKQSTVTKRDDERDAPPASEVLSACDEAPVERNAAVTMAAIAAAMALGAVQRDARNDERDAAGVTGAGTNIVKVPVKAPSLPGKSAEVIRKSCGRWLSPLCRPGINGSTDEPGKDHDPTNRWSGSSPCRHGGVQSRTYQP